MSNLTEKIRDLLSSHDEVVKQYRGIYNGTEGIIALTHEQVLFLREQGFLKKQYKTMAQVPYAQITDVTDITTHKFDIMQGKETFSIVTIGIPSEIVVDALQHLIESSKPTPKTVKVMV